MVWLRPAGWLDSGLMKNASRIAATFGLLGVVLGAFGAHGLKNLLSENGTTTIWEKAVFGRYLFADAFFWEDAFSMLVLALHTAYIAALITDFVDARAQMAIALAAYAAYAVNATQFLLKLRAARRQFDWTSSDLVGHTS